MLHQKYYSLDLIKTEVFAKKGKDALVRDNHCRIVVTPLLRKLVEHVVVGRDQPMSARKQDCLQFGFTEGLSAS